MRKVLVSAAVLAVPIALAAPAAAATTGGTATVSVLHAVPGLTVDVYANGEELIADFTPGTLTDPLQLPAGEYDLAVYPAGADPAATQPAISANDVAVPAGANATVVAHLSASGAPTLTPFVNDTAALGAGEAGLTVRHTAAAPAVDVRAGGTPVLTNLTNPNEASAVVDAGTVSADVVLAGTSTVAIGPADLPLGEGTRTIVYAWGFAEDDDLQLAVQTIDDLGSAPGGVPAGLTGAGGEVPGWVLPAGVVLLAAAGVGGARALASRR